MGNRPVGPPANRQLLLAPAIGNTLLHTFSASAVATILTIPTILTSILVFRVGLLQILDVWKRLCFEVTVLELSLIEEEHLIGSR